RSHALKRDETATQQTSGDENEQRHADLRSHECATKSIALASTGRTACRFAECASNVTRRLLKRGNESDDDSGDERQRDREQPYASDDARVREARNISTIETTG